MSRDRIGFTLDCRALGNILAQDPTALNDLITGVNEARAGQLLPLTTKLGAANLSGQDGDQAVWFGLFPSTVRGVAPGTPGLFYRNNGTAERPGDGTRIHMRLRRQTKRPEAVTPGATLPVQAATAPVGVPMTPADHATVQRARAILARQQGQVSVQAAPAAVPQTQQYARVLQPQAPGAPVPAAQPQVPYQGQVPAVPAQTVAADFQDALALFNQQ